MAEENPTEEPPLELHPDDTDRLHLDLATKAVSHAKSANRTYVFHMPDRIEIAFAQVRSLLGYDPDLERSFDANYHTGISMDFATADILHHNLGIILEGLKGEHEKREEDGSSE